MHQVTECYPGGLPVGGDRQVGEVVDGAAAKAGDPFRVRGEVSSVEFVVSMDFGYLFLFICVCVWPVR